MVQLVDVDNNIISTGLSKCAFCGEEFRPKRNNKTTCLRCRPISIKCRRIIHKHDHGMPCERKECDNYFLPIDNPYILRKKPWKDKYCSKECYYLETGEYIIKECLKCNNPFPINKKYKDSKNVFCSTLCRREYSRYQKCERCGKTFSDQNIKPLCLDCFFNNYATRCLNCNEIIKKNRKRIITEENFNLVVHHIDYNKQNVDPTNLITLCKHHHMKTNWNRKFWVKLFSNYQLWRGLYD